MARHVAKMLQMLRPCRRHVAKILQCCKNAANAAGMSRDIFAAFLRHGEITLPIWDPGPGLGCRTHSHIPAGPLVTMHASCLAQAAWGGKPPIPSAAAIPNRSLLRDWTCRNVPWRQLDRVPRRPCYPACTSGAPDSGQQIGTGVTCSLCAYRAVRIESLAADSVTGKSRARSAIPGSTTMA